MPPKNGSLPPVLDGKRALWLLLVYLLIQAVVALPVFIAAGIYVAIRGGAVPAFTTITHSGAFLMPVTLVALLASGAVVFTMVHRSFPGSLGGGVLSPVGWTGSSLRPMLIAALGGAVLVVIFHYVATEIFPRSSTQKMGAFVTAAAASHGWPKLIWVVNLLVCAPIEEFLFRGGMLAGFTRSFGTARSAAIVTIIFVLLHLSETQLYYPAIVSISALALSTLAARYWSGSLIPPICLHFSYNLSIALYAVLH